MYYPVVESKIKENNMRFETYIKGIARIIAIFTRGYNNLFEKE